MGINGTTRRRPMVDTVVRPVVRESINLTLCQRPVLRHEAAIVFDARHLRRYSALTVKIPNTGSAETRTLSQMK